MADNRLDVVRRHALGAQDVGEELTFAGDVCINVIITGLCELLFECGICGDGVWVVAQIIAYEQMVANTRGGVVTQIEVVTRQVLRRIKCLTPSNPQVTPMHIPEGGEICDDSLDGVYIMHNDVYVDDRFGGQSGYCGTADVFDGHVMAMEMLSDRVGQLGKKNGPLWVIRLNNNRHGCISPTKTPVQARLRRG